MNKVYSIKIRKGIGNSLAIWLVIVIGWVAIQTIAEQSDIIDKLEERKAYITKEKGKLLASVSIKNINNINYINKSINNREVDDKYNKFRKAVFYHNKDRFEIYNDKIRIYSKKVGNITGIGKIVYDK